MTPFNLSYTFITLHRLTLEAGATNGFYFSDPAIIMKMAVNWKHVQVLKFRLLPFSRTNEPSKITTSDLIAFAQHCPDLEELSLPFDATHPRRNSGANFPWKMTIPKTKLSILFIGDSPIKKATLIGANLSAIFISLRYLKTIEYEEACILGTDVRNWQTRNKAWTRAEKQMVHDSHIRNKNGDEEIDVDFLNEEGGNTDSDEESE
ncbi:hypothetical protein BDQ17DRAFT_1419247 [Cyathus striatus]|nr:hypothetical protein BDQ17DRAFT_1419247 [Cyathus striatus]